jgi:hypothetical protein
LLGVVAALFLSYLFYVPYGREEWSYLRFLLPAYPSLIVLSAAVVLEIVRRVTVQRRSYLVASIALCAVLVAWLAREADRRGAFVTHLAERRYVDVGRYVATVMPPDAAFIAGLHAGSIRYYADRPTVRYDWLEPRWLDEAVKALAANGYHPYIALDEGEEAGFRDRFGRGELARLDWPPAAERSQPIRVRIYDPADRPRFLAGQAVSTGEIGIVRRPALRLR